jgi:hypothetical protein
VTSDFRAINGGWRGVVFPLYFHCIFIVIYNRILLRSMFAFAAVALRSRRSGASARFPWNQQRSASFHNAGNPGRARREAKSATICKDRPWRRPASFPAARLQSRESATVCKRQRWARRTKRPHPVGKTELRPLKLMVFTVTNPLSDIGKVLGTCREINDHN